MKTTLACLAATLLTVPIWAAECVAEWTDFSSEHLTSGAMTLNLSGNTYENGYAEIGTAPLLITGTAAWNPRSTGDNPTNTPLTLVLRFSNLTNDDTLTELQALVSLTLGTSDNMVGLMTRVRGGAPVGMWEGNLYTTNATMSALPSNKREYILVFTYGESGTQAWVLENGAWNERFTCGGLRGSGTVGGKIALGAKTDGTLPATGLRIHAVSVWKGALSESERNGAVALLNARERTLVEGAAEWQAENAWGEGVDAPSADEAARLTLTGDATLTMNAAASVGALAVDGEGTLRFAPDTEGNTLTSPLTLVNANVNATSGVASLGAVSIATGKTLTVSTTPSLSIATGANAGTLQVIGGSEASPVVLSAGNVAHADIGQVELAENTTLRLHATGGNKVYRVRGAGSSSVLLLTSGQGWGLTKDGTALDNLTLVIPATVDGTTANANFWMTPSKTTSSVHFRTERQITGENDGGTFDFASIAGSGNFLGVGRHLRISDGANAVYSGVFSGAGSFVKAGEGTQTLSGANTYTGGTTIEGGILKLTDGGVPGTGTVTINSGTLEVAANASKTLANALSGAGAIEKTGTGTASLTGDLSGFTGTVTVTEGTLDVSTATFGETAPTFAFGEGSTGTLILPAGKEGTLSVPTGATLKLTLTLEQIRDGYTATNVTVPTGSLIFCDGSGNVLKTAGEDKRFEMEYRWTAVTPSAAGGTDYLWTESSNWLYGLVPVAHATGSVRVTLEEGQTLLVGTALNNLPPISFEGTGTVDLTALPSIPAFANVAAGITLRVPLFAEVGTLEGLLAGVETMATLRPLPGGTISGTVEGWYAGAKREATVTRGEDGAVTATATIPPNGAYAGSAWHWDYEFTDSLANTGSDAAALSQDGSAPLYVTLDETTGNKAVKFKSTPYRSVTYGTAFTAVMRCQPAAVDNTALLGFGTKNGTCIILATGANSAAGDMRLCLWQNGTLTDLVAGLSVPNATEVPHLYAFTLAVKDEKTQIAVYVDGKRKTVYKAEGVISLGGGFQIGSVHGGIVEGLTKYANDEGSLDFLRTTSGTLTMAAMQSIADAYPYDPVAGTATRAVTTGGGDWVATEGTPWQQELPGQEVAAQAAPNAGTNVVLKTQGAATLALNLPEDAVYESLEVLGDGGSSLRLTTTEGNTTTMTVGDLSVRANLTLPLGALNIGTLEVSTGKTLTFDISRVDFASVWESQTIPLTGLAQLGAGASVGLSGFDAAAIAPRTAEAVFDERTESYNLVITVPEGGLVATVDGAKDWSALEWTFGDGTVTPDWATLPNAKVTLRLAEGASSATVIYDVTDASLPDLGSLTIGEGVTFDIPATSRRNFALNTVTNHGEMIVREAQSLEQIPAYPGKVEFKDLTVTGQQVGFNPDELLIREGDTVRFTGSSLPRYSAPKITMTGGALNLATGNTAFWLGDNTTIEQSGGTVTMVPASGTASGSGNGLLLGFSRGTTYNLSGGALDVSTNFLNYWSSSSMNVSGTGVLKMKGAFKGHAVGTLTLSDNGRIELTGAQGLPAGVLSTFTLNGGTLAATANTSIAANATVSGTVALEAAQGATMTVSGALTGAATLKKTGAGSVVLTESALNGFTGTFVVEAGALQVPSTCTATITVAAGGALKVPVTEEQARAGYTYTNTNLTLEEGANVTFVLPNGWEVEGEGTVLPALTYYKWTPGASNNWSEVNNWTYMLDGTHALPTGDAQVVIDATAAAQTITMDTDATVALTVKGTNPVTIDGEGTLTIKGSEDEANPRIVAGDLRISGHLATSGHVDLDIRLPSGTFYTCTGALTVNDGTLTLKTSTMYFFNDARVTVTAGASLRMAAFLLLEGASTLDLHGALDVNQYSLFVDNATFNLYAGASVIGTGSVVWKENGERHLNVISTENDVATTVDIAPTVKLGGGAQLHVAIADGVTLNANGGLSSQTTTTTTEGTKLFVDAGTMALKGAGSTFTHPVEIGAAATVEVYPLTVDASLQANTLTTGAISGSGRLILKEIPLASTTGLNAEGWTGTVKFEGTVPYTQQFENYGNANSTIAFGTCSVTFPYSGTKTYSSNIAIEGTLSSTAGFSNWEYTFSGSLSGEGAINLSANTPDFLKFTGDCSRFAGAITVAGNRCIAFGSSGTKAAGEIVVGTDGEVTIAEGKTWTAVNGVVVNGTIGGAGTIGSALTLADGATLNAAAGALTVTGTVTTPGSVTVRASEPGVVLKASGLDATKFALAEGAPANLTLVATDSALVAVAVPEPEAETPMEAAARVAIAQAAATQGVTSVTKVEGNADAAALFTNVVSVTPSAEGSTQGTATVAYDFGIQSLTIRPLTVDEATGPTLYVVLAAKVQGAEGTPAGYLGRTAVKVYRVGPETDEAGKPVLKKIDGQVSADVLPGASGTEQLGVKWIYFPYGSLIDMGTFYFKVKASSETP